MPFAAGWIGPTWTAFRLISRRTAFSRKAAGDTAYDRVEEQVLVANVDLAFIVAAAGNDNTDKPSYPAAWPNVISVGALNTDDTRAPFSNRFNASRLTGMV